MHVNAVHAVGGSFRRSMYTVGAMERASDRAYRTLRDGIIDGSLMSGTLLGEVELAERLGVSRTPVREALARLTADGLVAAAGRGVAVTAVDASDIREIFAVRAALEVQAVRLAAERGSDAAFAELEQGFAAADTLLADDDAQRHGYFALVARFDEAVDEASGNPYLLAALAPVRTHLARIRRLARDDDERLRDAAREHLLIVRAVRARDAELAAHATHVHLHQALQSALRIIENRQESA